MFFSTIRRLGVSTALLIVFALPPLSIRHASAGQQSPDLPAQARNVLSEHCARCHGQNGIVRKNVVVLDRDRLIASQVLVPGDPDSLLLKIVESNAMPPEGAALSNEEKKILREWVMAGAPTWNDKAGSQDREFIDERKLIALIEGDLLSQPDRSRQFLRYFSLTHLYNAGVSDQELDTYRAALGKLINSLSWHKEITRPVFVDTLRTLCRIDLRDYDWTAATWESILSAYPYGLQSVEASTVKQMTGARVPYIKADWFTATASAPPLYHELLGLPRSSRDIERQLGVDVSRDLAEEKNVARAGLRASGVSKNNRVLERHVSLHGAYWRSFDFRNSTDQQNIFEHPIALTPAGSEIIFNLPNGLQAYLLIDGLERRIDEAPIAVVSDRTNSDDPVIRNGRSCMSCHYDGVRHFRDEMRPVLLANSSTTFDREKALALYVNQENLDRLMERDRERFNAAVILAAGSTAAAPHLEPINALARRYTADLSLSQAAAETGLKPQDFKDRIRRSNTLARLGYGQLIVADGAVKRVVWERSFYELASELSLGRPLWGPISASRNSSPATLKRLSSIPAVDTNPDSILRSARTISVSSMTMFLKPDQLEDELRKRPEFREMGLAIVKDATKADLMIDLDRPVFTYTFTFSVSSADTRVVVISGKVVAFDGNLAAPKIAKELMKRFGKAREESGR